MKLVSFEHAGKIHYGAVKNGRVIDLSARLGGQYPDIISFIAHDGKQVAQAIIAESNGDYDYDQLNLLSVIPNPGKILCVGLNYHDHVTEANNAIGNRKAPDRAKRRNGERDPSTKGIPERTGAARPASQSVPSPCPRVASIRADREQTPGERPLPPRRTRHAPRGGPSASASPGRAATAEAAPCP